MKARYLLVLVSILFAFPVKGQWQNVKIFSSDSLPHDCSTLAPVGVHLTFSSPTSSYCWYYRGQCGVHVFAIGGIFSSDDSCKNWQENTDAGGYQYESFYDTIINWGSNSFGSFFQRSVDNGKTWNGFSTFNSFVDLPQQISMYSGNYGYGCNYSDGKFFRIDHDTCYKILDYNRPTHWNIFQFFSDSVGICSASDTLFRTQNGGTSWDTILIDQIDSINYFNQLFFLNDTIAYLITTGNQTYRTENKGLHWQFIPLLNNIPFGLSGYGTDTIFGIYNSLHPYYDTTFTSYLLKSNDAGYHWDTIPFFVGFDIINIKMFNADFGYVLGVKNFDYYIFQTKSGIEKSTPPKQSINKIYPNPFIDKITVHTKVSNGIIQIIDYLGKIVYSEYINGEIEKIIYLNLPSGFYFFRIGDENGYETIKLVSIKH